MKKIFYTSVIIYTLFFGTPVYAQTPSTAAPITREYTVLAPIPGTTKTCTGSGQTEKCTADINSYLDGFLNIIISIGAIIAMLYLAYYGFLYAISDSAPVKMETKGKLFEISTGLLLIISAYAIVYTINPKILPEDGFSLDISLPFIQGGSVTGSSVQRYPLEGYDIGPYATAPTHELIVTNVYNQLKSTIGNNITASTLNDTLKKLFPQSPLTGQMIFDAAQKYQVNPILMMSLMQVDSGYGTQGLAVTTRNPGNVGNMDDGSIRRFNSWSQGVDAVANWLSNHKVK